jgi:hypothetical protein
VEINVTSLIDNRELQLLVATLTILALFIAPLLAKKILLFSKRSSSSSKKNLWLLGELFIAICIVLSFLAASSALALSSGVVVPWLLDLDPKNISMDTPLTSRLLLYWVGVLLIGWVVFRSVGLNSTRDVHRSVKEIYDDFSQSRKNRAKPKTTTYLPTRREKHVGRLTF